MRTKSLGVLATVLVLTITGAAQDRIDFTVIEKIRAEGMDRSKVLETFDYLTTVIGPRLTNSPAHKRSVAWTQETLKAWGMSEVHAEPFQFGRGWTLDKVSVELVEPRYMPMIGYPKGWSPATAGRVMAAPVWLPGLEAEALKAQAGKLKGAILLTSPLQDYAIRADRPAASGDLKAPQPAPSRPPQLNAERLALLKTEGVAVTIDPKVTVVGDKKFEDIALEDWGANFDLNLVGGVVIPCQEFGPAMVKRKRGSIINIASVSAHIPLSRVVAYSASKAAVISLTQFLSREWARDGVRVNTITPGFFPAEQNRRLLFNEGGTPTPRAASILAHTPMGRMGEPNELAGAAVFLASHAASSFVTGIDIRVDGGFLSQTI